MSPPGVEGSVPGPRVLGAQPDVAAAADSAAGAAVSASPPEPSREAASAVWPLTPTRQRGERRPLIVGASAALGVLAGAAAQLPAAQVASDAAAAAVATVGLLAAVALCPLLRRAPHYGATLLAPLVLGAMAMLAGASLGWSQTHWRAASRLGEALVPELIAQDLTLVGEVAELPQHGLMGARFVFEVDEARWNERVVSVPRRLSLAWYRSAEPDALLLGPDLELRAGQRWRLPVRLRPPHGAMNPHGFDLEGWLFERDLRATGSVRSRAGASAELLDAPTGRWIERARQAVRDRLQARVADHHLNGVLAALAIGDQAAIERDDWDLFRITGVAHLMSISGLHVTLFAWAAAGLIGLAWRQSERLLLWRPVSLAARWGGLLSATLYALVAGWGVPAQRTLLMLAVVVALRSARLRWPLALVLLAAAVVVTLADPWALLQPGFWLSFAAVGLLWTSGDSPGFEAAAAPGAGPRGWGASLRAHAAAGLRQQAVATVGLAPLSLLFFQQISVVGFIANLAAIPLVTLVITPLALLGVLAPPLWQLAAWVTAGLNAFLAWLAAWPGAVWYAGAAPGWAVAAGLFGALVAAGPWPHRLRWWALPLMLPMLAPVPERAPAGEFSLLAADIGQGTAVLVRTRTHALLYDTGPQTSAESDAGSRVLLPLLRALGVRRLDQLMLSHRDSDHIGGAAALLRAGLAAEVRSSLEPEHALLSVAAAVGASHRRCDAGQRWAWDGVEFELLHPQAEDHAQARKPNALSCVLRIRGRGATALLTGDIEARDEAALVARHGPALAAQVLLVPHHGSRTSSTPDFIRAVAPRVAVVQAGYLSRFGHPAPDILARYEAQSVPVVRSDACGAWRFESAGPALGLCHRREAARYWHHPPGDGTP